MIGIALVLGVPLAILVALYLVSPQRWRKASVPADALPFRNRVFSALKRAALAWVWGMLALLLASAALAELPFPVPFSILGWSVPVAVVLAAVWGVLRPRTYEDRVDVSDNESDIEQEVPSASQRMDNYRKEDADEYIDNGAYIPDSEEDDEQDDTEGTTHNSGTSLLSQSITFILTAIVSIALGAVLYYVFA